MIGTSLVAGKGKYYYFALSHSGLHVYSWSDLHVLSGAGLQVHVPCIAPTGVHVAQALDFLQVVLKGS